MARAFILYKAGLGGERVSVQILTYNRDTHHMRVRCKHGMEYDWTFDPKSESFNKNFRIATIKGEDNAKWPKLRTRHPAGEADGEEAG